MKTFRRLCSFCLFVGLVFNFSSGQANENIGKAMDLDELLDEIKKVKSTDDKINVQRETEFLDQKNRQQALLDQSITDLKKLQQLSDALEKEFAENEMQIVNKRDQLQMRLGTLQELFGHLTAAAGDFRSNLSTSIISAQYPGREQVFDALISKMDKATLLPEVSEIEAMWFEMLREMNESSKVVSFEAEVNKPDGATQKQQIIRIGSFNLLSENKYLSYSAEDETIEELSRQPPSNITASIAGLLEDPQRMSRIGIDPTGPTGGSYLSALVDSPTLTERWHQGGIIGYLITAIGVLAALLAIWRFIVLSIMESSVRKLLNNISNYKNYLENALGRLLSIHLNNPDIDAETLEAKLAEAILQERPAIERYLPLLKIIAMVAPLMGLLGTVAGMIITFQAITIFGAGDPKTMAGGISSALVTTVLGLLVAIPTVFAHSLLNSKAQNILQILEHQSMGWIAQHTEANSHKNL